MTARKRTERLIDVPVAATVLGKETLSRYNSTSLSSLSQQVPSLIIAESGVQTGGSTTLRGVGASNFNPTSDQLVSVNVDGIQVSQGNILRLGQYDLERLEVLKGPQTLFFGKNSPGAVARACQQDEHSSLTEDVLCGETGFEGPRKAPNRNTAHDWFTVGRHGCKQGGYHRQQECRDGCNAQVSDQEFRKPLHLQDGHTVKHWIQLSVQRSLRAKPEIRTKPRE